MPRKEKKYHFIYKTTNLLNGKYYIGMHSAESLNDGYLGSGKRLRYSINKHGKKNHVREILELFETREELVKREKEVICLDEIAKELCMNLCVGGEGGLINSIEKMRENSILGNKQQSFLRKNNIEWAEKDFNIRSNRMKKEFEEKIRTTETFRFNKSGWKHSDDAKKKISEKSKTSQLGNKNSQFGTCWITKDGENKKIKKEFIKTYLIDGWVKGKSLKLV